MTRRLTVIATAVGCAGALMVPVAGSSTGSAIAAPTATSVTSQSACGPVPTLRSSAITTRRNLGPNASLTIWSDPLASSSWWGARELQVSLVKANLATTILDVRSNNFPGATDPLALADQTGSPEPVAMINGDFFDMFDTGDNSPRGPVVQDGKLLYAPYTRALVVGQTKTVLPPDEIQKVTGTVKLGSYSVPVKSINARTVPRNSGALYDRRWSAGATLPLGTTAITIRRGVVVSVGSGFAVRAPRAATSKVLLVPKSQAATVARIKVGMVATVYVTPTDGTSDQPKTVYGIDSTFAKLEGSLVVGTVTIPIGALNYHNVTGTQADAFDANWARGAVPKGGATVVYSGGKITSVSRNGSDAAVPAGSTVIQLPGKIARRARAIHVGDTATLDLSLKTQSGATFTEALGHGSYVLQDGVIHASCTWAAETDRPRTLLGWNDTGRIFMLVSTSGRPDTWGGYRVGGATINEMTTWLKAMGATNAVNFDGGGSTILVTKRSGAFRRVDLPKNTYRRPVPNAVAFVAR